jgi:hypothetical protein
VADNLVDYIEHFSPNVRDVFDGFRMMDQIADLAKSDRLYLIVKEFAAVDLHPKVVSGHDMGYIFEELIRKFAESNSTQAKLHPTNIAQKVQIIIEHFRENVGWRLDGKVKAMVVTSSRKAAVRYKLAFDKYVAEKGYTDVAALVAFSGDVTDDESGLEKVTETSMNPGLKGRDLRDAFATDEHRVMLVANKFQTGFDQPLLVGMYVDKRLSGVAAVQTLSRLNRVAAGKGQTFVLDFANTAEDIVEAFEPYYEATTLADVTDPNIVHGTMAKLDAAGIYQESEVNGLVADYLANKGNNALTKMGHPRQGPLPRPRARRHRPRRQARPRRAGAVPQGRRHLHPPVRLPIPDRQLRRPIAGEVVHLPAPPRPGDQHRAAQP